MLWACLYFPELPLDAVRPPGVAAEAAAALIDGPRRNPRIVLLNRAARAAGIRSGQSLAAARVLQADLPGWWRDAQAEQGLLQSLAELAYRFSSEVCLAAPRAVLLEIGASLELFGGWTGLQHSLCTELDSWGLHYRLAAAPTATAAQVLAVSGHQGLHGLNAELMRTLSDISLSKSGLEKKTSSQLSSMGLERLGQVFALPRAELGRRIGPAALLHLDRMRGLAAEVWSSYRPAQHYQQRLEFEAPAHSVPALRFALQRLLRDLCRFLCARDGGVQRFELILEHEREATTRLTVGLLEARRDPALLLDLAHKRLERISLVAPVLALSVRADELPSLRPRPVDLFENRSREGVEWPVLLERLRARLGDEAIGCYQLVADHRPDHAWRRYTLGSEAASTGATPARLPLTSPRPLWLLRRPIPLRQAPLQVLAGPERIESGWWDGDDQRHDYYVVLTPAGQRAWVFVAAGETGHWMLRGWFA